MFSQFMAVKHNLEDEVPNGRYKIQQTSKFKISPSNPHLPRCLAQVLPIPSLRRPPAGHHGGDGSGSAAFAAGPPLLPPEERQFFRWRGRVREMRGRGDEFSSKNHGFAVEKHGFHQKNDGSTSKDGEFTGKHVCLTIKMMVPPSKIKIKCEKMVIEPATVEH